ncbi:hypothetical protein [Streptomyces sp. H27-C3]|uniref:hypothetical protein n=1 Tax=Streptomyces sp. H27-C3 TaxID=3046305 RepID=UPI0024BB93F9|nr:hypothetical protein [Streptomyces sp. H27-C3]MDJ0463102.1 hypothetical protein [Streptomyces sp. H27-C3]
MTATHQSAYHELVGPLSKQVRATCTCGWEQDLVDCGSQLRAYLLYADHLREEAVADSQRAASNNSTQHDRRAA